VHINSERRIVGFETVLVNGDHRTMIGKEASTRNSFEVDFPDDERVVNVIYRKHRYGPDEITVRNTKPPAIHYIESQDYEANVWE